MKNWSFGVMNEFSSANGDSRFRGSVIRTVIPGATGLWPATREVKAIPTAVAEAALSASRRER
jgi:hypothetical protein